MILLFGLFAGMHFLSNYQKIFTEEDLNPSQI